MIFYIFLIFFSTNPSIKIEGEPMYFSQTKDKTQVELPKGGSLVSDEFLIEAGYLFSDYDLKGNLNVKGSNGILFSNDSYSLLAESFLFDNQTLNISGNVEGFFEDFLKFKSDTVVLDFKKNNLIFEKTIKKPLLLYRDFSLSSDFFNFDLSENFFSGEKNVQFHFSKDFDFVSGTADSFNLNMEENLVSFYEIFLNYSKGYDIKSEYVEMDIQTMEMKSNGYFELKIDND